MNDVTKALKALEKLAQLRETVIDRSDGCISFPEKGMEECHPELFSAIRAALSDQWKPSGAEYDGSIHSNTDASAWADLFLATFPNCGADWATMVGWFANAMMAMHDSAASTADQQGYDKTCAAVQGTANGLKVGRANAERETQAKILFNAEETHMENQSLRAEVEQLRSQLADVAKDAERYRHIRGMFGFNSFGIFLPCGPTRNKDELAAETDAAIDAQVAQSGVTN